MPTITPSTYGDLCASWLEIKRAEVSRSSHIKYELLLRRYILPRFGQLSFGDLSEPGIERGLADIASPEDDNPPSKSIMASVRYVVCAVLDYGAQLGYFHRFRIEFKIVDSEKKEPEVLLPKEQELLVACLSDTPGSIGLGILLSLFTGMRLGEVCALRRMDVDLERDILYLRNTVKRIKTSGEGKGKTELMVTALEAPKQRREIPISKFLHTQLEAYGLEGMGEEDYLLRRGVRPYEPRKLQYGFKTVLKDCGLKEVNYNTLRHTFAMNCIRLGFDVKSLSELLGHVSVNVTLERYVQSDMEKKRNQMNRII